MSRTRSATSRAATSRQAEMRQRPQNEYQSPLYIPPGIIPKGVTYRWLAEAVLQQPQNLGQRLRVGWRPVPASRHPEFSVPSIAGFNDHVDQSLIRVDGLLLCERPTRDVERDAEFAQMRSDQAVNGSDYKNDETDGVPRFDDSVTAIEQVTARDADFK